MIYKANEEIIPPVVKTPVGARSDGAAERSDGEIDGEKLHVVGGSGACALVNEKDEIVMPVTKKDGEAGASRLGESELRKRGRPKAQ